MRAIGLYWVFSCLLTALFVQQSRAGSVLTWQPQIEIFFGYYHGEWNNLISGHWTRSAGECRTLAGQSSLRVISAEQKQWSREVLIHVFSPKGEWDQGCIFCSAPPVSQRRLCCTWYQGKRQVYVQPLTHPGLNQILSWKTQLRNCRWKHKGFLYLRTIGSPMASPLGAISPLFGRAAYPCLMQNLCNETDAGFIHSLSAGLLLQTLPEDAVYWSQLQGLLEFWQGENFF